MRRSLPKGGPDFLRCVGETAFVAQAASIARAQKAPTQIAGIVAHADLRLAELDDVLDAHEEPPRVSSEVYVMQVPLPET